MSIQQSHQIQPNLSNTLSNVPNLQIAPQQRTIQAFYSEASYMQIASLSESMNDFDRAIHAYEMIIKHNPMNVTVLQKLSHLYIEREKTPQAIEVYQKLILSDSTNPDYWYTLGTLYFAIEDHPKSYDAYLKGLSICSNQPPKDILYNMWWSIALLLEKWGYLELAEQYFIRFLNAMKQVKEKETDKSSNIDSCSHSGTKTFSEDRHWLLYYKLGCIYSIHKLSDQCMECFTYISKLMPPKGYTVYDIYYQIGLLFERKGDIENAKTIYEGLLKEPNLPNSMIIKANQQLGWLLNNPKAPFYNPDLSFITLNKALELDNRDPYSWYLLGRYYAGQKSYSKAYDAYQHAIMRDYKNPLFWNSMGFLYFNLNQYRDALESFIKAIKLNFHISEVWINLGLLYEVGTNQINDAIEAYRNALLNDRDNAKLKAHIAALKPGGNAEAQKIADSNNLSSQLGPVDTPPLTYFIIHTFHGGQTVPEVHPPMGNSVSSSLPTLQPYTHSHHPSQAQIPSYSANNAAYYYPSSSSIPSSQSNYPVFSPDRRHFSGQGMVTMPMNPSQTAGGPLTPLSSHRHPSGGVFPTMMPTNIQIPSNYGSHYARSMSHSPITMAPMKLPSQLPVPIPRLTSNENNSSHQTSISTHSSPSHNLSLLINETTSKSPIAKPPEELPKPQSPTSSSSLKLQGSEAT